MKHFQIIFIIILLLLHFLSCKKDESNPVNNLSTNSVILPLNVGNYWIYKSTTYNPNGGVLFTSMDTISVISQQVIDNETWSQYGGGKILYTNRADGLYIRDTLQPTISPQLYFKYPGKIGDSWYNLLSSDTTTIISTSQQTNVINGIHECYEYRMLVDITSNEIFFKPGLGLVLQEVFLIYSGQTYRRRQELYSYYLH